MQNIVIEGARGLGKSTVAQYIRSHSTNSTLINFTGFNENGQAGLDKVLDYYASWMGMFKSLKGHESTYIHDRFFFSEMVYSKLYKDYDFTNSYNGLVNYIPTAFDQLELFVLVTYDELKLAENLTRDKVMLFSDVEESVGQSFLQQAEYVRLAEDLDQMKLPGINVYFISVDGKTIPDISTEIMALSNAENSIKL